ncbi:MAG: GNAT family N-acetyltransferase [Boseongicola sp.]|nr:GNAT family N-acetyltransferase [Boseongicola sp.]
MTHGDLFADFLKTDRSKFIGGPYNDYRASTRAWGHMVGLWVMRGYSSHVWTLKDDTVIGHGGPWYPATWPEPEFGWTLYDAAHEGKGYAIEAMTTLRDWAWSYIGLTSCVAYIDPDNHASANLAKRLGGALDTDTTERPGGNENADVWRFHSGTAA